jgi:DNA-binding transcriptional ArsR family regulator
LPDGGKPLLGNKIMANDALLAGASDAARFLKALANENRLLILCHLAEGEMSVTALERSLGIRQPTLSQQLARLRSEDLVATRREGKTIYYSLASDEVMKTLQLMHGLFCSADASQQHEEARPRKARQVA